MQFATFAQFVTPFNKTGSVDIADSDPPADARVQQILEWLQKFAELAGGELMPASDDASFRRYFRIKKGDISRIVMDAPPKNEDCRSFINVAGALRDMGVNAPQVLTADLTEGFLLLTDLGDDQYLSALRAAPESADRLYRDAIDTLLKIQRNGDGYVEKLPAYGAELLCFELTLFSDWLCDRHLGFRLQSEHKNEWEACCRLLVNNALQQPQVFVHRDYHSRNLMLVDDSNPGVLDFQDAVFGPYTYDLVSLLKDCYIAWPDDQRDAWATLFHEKRGPELGVDKGEFQRQYDLMGVQRHLKAAGIFARLNHRDGKSGYLQDIPRTLNYVLDVVPRYPELEFLAPLIKHEVLPRLERQCEP